MPYNGSGTYTPPAADFPAVTQTVISSTKFNNILNDVSAALTNAVTRDGQSPMTAALPMGGWPINGISLGSAGLPSINFTGNTTTGIYAAASLVGVSLGGSGVLFITPTGLGWRMSPSYELSIGGASTLVNAQIRSTGSFGVSGSSALLRFDDAGGSKGYVGFDGDGSAKLRLYNSYAAGGIIFGANNTVHMELDGQGRLAIAQGNAPTQILNLYRGGATQVVMAAGNSATGLNGSYFGVDTLGNCLIMQTQSLAMVFGTSSSERMRLDSSGNLGIGTTNAGTAGLSISQSFNLSWEQSATESVATLFRQTSSAALVIASGYKRSNTANAFASSIASSWAKSAISLGTVTGTISFYTDAAAAVAVGTDITPTERMRIGSAGNVTINAPSSGTALAINSVNTTTPYINYVTGGTTTVGAAGGASALPATPVGYVTIAVAGTSYKMPYYNT